MSEKLQNMLEPAANENSLAALLKQPVYAKRFEAVLGERSAQFASSLLSIANTMRDVEPRSIIGSAMIAAALDLPIDKNLGFAWIVPYKKDGVKVAQFILGWKGAVQLAQRSGQYSRMNATPINQEVFLGYDEVGEPNLDWDKYDPALPVWGYFFGFQLTNGFTKKAVWTKAKVIEHAKRYSQSYRSGAAIWQDQFDPMATKTLVSNTLRKWGPLSIQMQRGLQADQAIIRDVDAEPIYPELENSEPEKPVFEHPAKKEQEQQKQEQKAAAKAEPKSEPKKEPAKPKTEPKTETAPPAPPQDSKPELIPEPVLAPDGTAPSPPPLQETTAAATELPGMPEPPAAATIAEPTAPTPEPDAKIGAKQAELRDSIITQGFTWEDWIGWAKTAMAPVKATPPTSWAGISEVTAAVCLKNPKGVAAGIRGWKAKG